jgi:hypothetical protein
MKLRVAVIGYTYELSCRAIRILAKSDESKIKTVKKSQIIMEDDTEYFAISPDSYDSLRGYKFDQLIIVDDDRWEILYKHCGIINYIKQRILYYSFVPESFQVQKFEW